MDALQSGPEGHSQPSGYAESDLSSGDDLGYDSDSRRARDQRREEAAAASQQPNQVRQSTSSAQAAAQQAAAGDAAPSAPASNTDAVAALKQRMKQQSHLLAKRQLELDSKLNVIIEHLGASKRSKSKSSKADIDALFTSGDEGEEGETSDNGGDASSTSPAIGKQNTLRRQAQLTFATLGHVDIRVFSDHNITVRKEKELLSITYVQLYEAAWSAYNLELQQYLLSNNRVTDALMVTNYYHQLISLLTECDTQWALIMQLDDWIRSERFKVDDRVVWDFNFRNNRLESKLRGIQLDQLASARSFQQHQRAVRKFTASSANSDASSATAARGGSNRRSDKKSVCYAYNGEKSPGIWTSTNQCRGADHGGCKFNHQCANCGEPHPMYENPMCDAKSRDSIRAAPRRPRA